MSITPSLQLEQNGKTQNHQKHLKCYSREYRIWMGKEPSIAEEKLYRGTYFRC